ncbi:MAG: hypothetical protein WAN51_13320 [Alphaproteobacteria bacterium]
MIHFDDLYASPKFRKARGRAELLSQSESLRSLVGDAGFAARLKEACAFFIDSWNAPYGERLVRFIEDTVVHGGRAGARRKLRDVSPEAVAGPLPGPGTVRKTVRP